MKLPDWKLLEVPEHVAAACAVSMTHAQYLRWSVQRLQLIIKRTAKKRKKIYTSRGIMLLQYRQKSVEFFIKKLESYESRDRQTDRPIHSCG